MLFIFMTCFIWAVALFHIWDHRCFERDLRRYCGGATGLDWRVVSTGHEGGVCLRRAFVVNSREALLRYAVPVVFLSVCLLIFGSWVAAGLYGLAMACKWLVSVTVLDVTQRRYRVMVGRWCAFSAGLD